MQLTKSTKGQSTRWVFTVNNYTPDDEDLINQFSDDCKYLVYGKETAPNTGTPHLQGFFILPDKCRVLALTKKLRKGIYFAPANGTSKEASDYCKKEAKDIFESGVLPEETGKRTDLEAFKTAVKAGLTCMKRAREEFPEIASKYPRFCTDYIRDNIEEPSLEEHELNWWQQDLEEYLATDPNDREIVFVVDPEGNKGKSWYAKHYVKNHADSILIRPGKHADMAYILPFKIRVLFMDCTRKQVEFMPYTFMEELKDGYVQSTKYESCVKKYDKMHVIILMNQHPDMTALSTDRYNIKELPDNR